MALTTGTQAPDFTLKTKNADGLQDVTLSENFGKKKTVLLFFPLAFTSVCMDEMCSVNSGLETYTKLNAAVYGISVDSPFTLEKMADVDQLRFPLLSDFNKDVSAAYDVLYPDLLGFKESPSALPSSSTKPARLFTQSPLTTPNNFRTSQVSSLHSKPKFFFLYERQTTILIHERPVQRTPGTQRQAFLQLART